MILACVAATAAQAQESGAEVEKRNFVEFFVGVTHDDGDNDASLGVTYERKFERFGTGFIAEVTNAEGREIVLALPFFWHPVEPRPINVPYTFRYRAYYPTRLCADRIPCMYLPAAI